MNDHPRSGFAAPPQGGNASGPAEPDPQRLLELLTVSVAGSIICRLSIALIYQPLEIP